MAEYKDVELLKKQIADFKRAVNAVKPMNSDYLTGYISALSAVEGAIAEQSAADVAPVRHGHWDTISDSDMSKTVMCSVCNKMFYFTKKGQLNIDKMPHCPNCGARMDGDEND